MSSSAHSLYKVYQRNDKLTPKIVQELFGSDNWSEDVRDDAAKFRNTVIMFNKVYRNMWEHGIPVTQIENCQITNTLDWLIDNVKDNLTPEIYQLYADSGIKIGNTASTKLLKRKKRVIVKVRAKVKVIVIVTVILLKGISIIRMWIRK
jgi:hypothetical protein